MNYGKNAQMAAMVDQVAPSTIMTFTSRLSSAIFHNNSDKIWAGYKAETSGTLRPTKELVHHLYIRIFFTLGV